jgi:hypothetical protein
MVPPAFRGLGLFELVMVDALIHASEHGFKTAVGGYRPTRGFKDMMHEIGFANWGPECMGYFKDGSSNALQLVIAPLPGDQEFLIARRQSILTKLSEQGWGVP